MYWLLSVSILFAYSLACLGLGLLISWIFKCCRREISPDDVAVDVLIEMSAHFLAGVALYSALWTFLGLAGQLGPSLLMLALIPGFLGLVLYRAILRSAWERVRQGLSGWKALPGWLSIIAASTVMLALACGVGAWVLPPKGDAAAFYLVYPKIIAATGTLEPMQGPYRAFSAIGLSIELHYAALMTLADDHAAKLFMFPVALSAGVMLAGIVRLCGGRIVAVVMSWAMLFSSYTFYHFIFDGKVDLAAAAFGLAAVYWLLRAPISKLQALTYAVSGWFAGLATVAKFPYFLVLGVVVLALLVWQQGINRPVGISLGASANRIARAGAWMALAAVLAWIPQLIKNSVLFDAPLAPFIGFSGNDNWLDQVWFSPDATRKILLTYPFALVLGRYPMQGGGLSFLFLIFAPCLLWLTRPAYWRQSMTTAVTFAAVLAVAAWMLLRPSVIAPRYILAPLLLLVPVLVLAVEDVLNREAPKSMLRVGIVTSVLAALVASLWHLLPIPGAILAGVSERGTACALAAPECDAMLTLSDVAQPDERIMIASYYPYWLTPSQLQCRDVPEERRAVPDKARLVAWLKTNGFAFVAVDPSVAKSLAEDLQQLAESRDAGVSELSSGPVVKLYRIQSEALSRVHCMNAAPGRWYLKKDEW